MNLIQNHNNIENTQTFRSTKRHDRHYTKSNGVDYIPSPIEGIDFDLIISLPHGENLMEWYAYNVFDFHRQVSMLFSTISEYCTCKTCPKMTAGSGYQYLWSEGIPSPIDMPAPNYIWRLLNLIENQLDDENIFPSSQNKPFPDNIEKIVKNIMKRLFRVYAHFYYHHINHFLQLKVAKELDTSFIHFIRFNNKYKLIQPQQLEPLSNLISNIIS